MMQIKVIQRFRNRAHILLPKELIGKKIKFVIEAECFDDIKSEVIEVLNPFLENILGIYLYGAYARKEETIKSDIDVLVVTNAKVDLTEKKWDFEIMETEKVKTPIGSGKLYKTIILPKIKSGNYNFVFATKGEINEILNHNAVLMLPIIREAITIINPSLLEEYKKIKFTKKNTGQFLKKSEKIFEVNKKGLELNFETGSLAYSLISRIKALLMIKLLTHNKQYSKAMLFNYLEKSFPKNKIIELYKIYSNEQDNVKIRESKLITKTDLGKLLIREKELIKETKKILKLARKNTKKESKSPQKEIRIHKNIKLEKTIKEMKTELSSYYEKEINRLEEQLKEKQKELSIKKKKQNLTVVLPNF